MTLRDVPADTSGAITPTGTPITVGPLTYGQNAQLTFQGVQGHRAALVLDAKTIPDVGATLQASDGSVLAYHPLYNAGEIAVVDLQRCDLANVSGGDVPGIGTGMHCDAGGAGNTVDSQPEGGGWP